MNPLLTQKELIEAILMCWTSLDPSLMRHVRDQHDNLAHGLDGLSEEVSESDGVSVCSVLAQGLGVSGRVPVPVFVRPGAQGEAGFRFQQNRVSQVKGAECSLSRLSRGEEEHGMLGEQRGEFVVVQTSTGVMVAPVGFVYLSSGAMS